jgi:EmrB/QacA subfamily drug resistance transporter
VPLLVAAALFMENLDATVIGPAAPAIARSLHVTAAAVGVAVTAYLVAVGAFVPLSGWLSRRFGVRRVLLCAVVGFTVTSVWCAASTSLAELVVARTAQGISGAFMVPVGQISVFRSTRKADLFRAVAFVTWPALAAPVVGPAVGGLLASYASWRWIFLVNVPLGALVVAAGWWLLPRGRDERPPPLDWSGFALAGAGLGLLVGTSTALSAASPDWVLGGGMGLVAAALVAVAIRHFRAVDHPLLDLGVLRVATMRLAFVSGGLFRAATTAVPFVAALQFEQAFGWSPARAGTTVLWLFVGNFGIKPATTPLLRRYGFRTVLTVALVVLAATIVVFAGWTARTPLPLMIVILAVSGAARSVGFTCLNTLAYADIDDAEMTAATTLGATLGQLAAGLGIVVASASVQTAGHLTGSGASGAARPFAVAFLALAVLDLVPLVRVVRAGSDLGRSVVPTRR